MCGGQLEDPGAEQAYPGSWRGMHVQKKERAMTPSMASVLLTLPLMSHRLGHRAHTHLFVNITLKYTKVS